MMTRDHAVLRSSRPRAWGAALIVTLAALGCGSDPDPSTSAATEEHEEGYVAMDSVGATAVGLEIVEVAEVTAASLEATGTVIYDQNRVSRVGPRAEGRVVRMVRDLGEVVEAGDALAVLESPDLGEAEADHAQAQAEVRLTRENHERERGLFEKGISSRKEFMEARTAFERAEAALGAAEARHRTLGAFDHPDDSVTVEGMYTLEAPVPGTVVERDLTLGQIVGPQDNLFTVADLTRLWLILDIYDRDLARVKEGLDVEVRASAFPGEAFRGNLTYLGQVVDSLTRTVKARVVIENPDRRLRPGTFATAVIQVPGAVGVVAVPEVAIQRMEGRIVVFVPVGPGRYQARDVVPGEQVGNGLVSILQGLSSGESVVAAGSFYLKSELLKESFGGDSH